MNTHRRLATLIVVAALTGPVAAAAQSVPFLFVDAPSPVLHPRSTLQLDLATGDGPLDAADGAGGSGALQGARAAIWLSSRAEVLARGATTLGVGGWAGQAEFRWRVMGAGGARPSVALGAGLRREWTGTDVLLGTVSGAYGYRRSTFAANVTFEHALEPGRDPVDLMTALGWSYQAAEVARVGVEALGEDLEGFWDPEEAEGGATVFVGPNLVLGPRASRWSVLVAGGAVFRGSHSARTSAATRDVTVSGSGYTVRMAVRLDLGE